MLLTDLCDQPTTRAPWDRSTPAPRTRTTTLRSRYPRPGSGGRALDGTHPASAAPWTTSLSGRRAPLSQRRLTAALSTAREAPAAPLTSRVPRRHAAGDRPPAEAVGPIPPLPRQGKRLLRSRDAFHLTSAPSLDRSRDLAREPATGLAALPPSIRLPAPFCPPALSRGEARPDALPRAHRPWAREARRRSSTSATENDPRARPSNRPNPAHRARGRPRAQLVRPSRDAGALRRSLAGAAPRRRPEIGRRRVARRFGRWLAAFRQRAALPMPRQSRCHGPGAGRGFRLLMRSTSSPRSLAGGASPQPDRLGHLLSRARGGAGLEWPSPPDADVERRASPETPAQAPGLRRTSARAPRPTRAPFGAPPSSPPVRLTLTRAPDSRAASRVPPRRGARYAAPEVPSIDERPVRAWPLFHSLSPACGVEGLRLFDPRVSWAFDETQGRDGLGLAWRTGR
jgi:hypothetical protein